MLEYHKIINLVLYLPNLILGQIASFINGLLFLEKGNLSCIIFKDIIMIWNNEARQYGVESRLNFGAATGQGSGGRPFL